MIEPRQPDELLRECATINCWKMFPAADGWMQSYCTRECMRADARLYKNPRAFERAKRFADELDKLDIYADRDRIMAMYRTQDRGVAPEEARVAGQESASSV